MKSLHRLHLPKQGMPIKHIPIAQYKSNGRRDSGPRTSLLMDAYSGYNQIKMHPTDEDKTAFTTGRAICCYKVMPFGLKNVGATFQRMVNKVFKELIRSTMEVYIDDMLVKSRDCSDHMKHLEETFAFL